MAIAKEIGDKAGERSVNICCQYWSILVVNSSRRVGTSANQIQIHQIRAGCRRRWCGRHVRLGTSVQWTLGLTYVDCAGKYLCADRYTFVPRNSLICTEKSDAFVHRYFLEWIFHVAPVGHRTPSQSSVSGGWSQTRHHTTSPELVNIELRQPFLVVILFIEAFLTLRPGAAGLLRAGGEV